MPITKTVDPLVKKLIGIYKQRGGKQLLNGVYHNCYGYVLDRWLGVRYKKKKIYDFQMVLDLQERGISRTLWLYGSRELDHKWLLEKTLKRGSTVLDIGANIGYYILLERKLVGSEGRIIAAEPSPENTSLLKKNIILNNADNVLVLPLAVSDADGVRDFWIAEESNLNSFHSEYLAESGTPKNKISVEVKSFHTLSKKYGPIDYVRMDIEGHEVEVLRNVSSLTQEGDFLPDIIFEAHNRIYGPERDIIRELHRLTQIGYTIPYVSSSTTRGTKKLEAMGLPRITTMRTDDTERTIHKNISLEHLQKCLNRSGGIRTVFLKSPHSQ